MRRTGALIALAAAAVVLAACGASSSHHAPDLGHVPLVPGARVVVRMQQCDPGASAYCALELVVYDRQYHSSSDFLLSERKALHAHGWTGANGDTGEESAADSPGHKLHLTYATAGGDLDGLAFRWITRPRQVWLALSNSIWDHAPALSMMLEEGNGAT